MKLKKVAPLSQAGIGIRAAEACFNPGPLRNLHRAKSRSGKPGAEPNSCQQAALHLGGQRHLHRAVILAGTVRGHLSACELSQDYLRMASFALSPHRSSSKLQLRSKPTRVAPDSKGTPRQGHNLESYPLDNIQVHLPLQTSKESSCTSLPFAALLRRVNPRSGNGSCMLCVHDKGFAGGRDLAVGMPGSHGFSRYL